MSISSPNAAGSRSLVQAIRDQERRHQVLSAELADLKPPRVVPMTAPQLRVAVLCEKASEWRALHGTHTSIARQMLRKLVEGRIVFTPDQQARRYTFRATGTLATFFSGIVCPQAMASPTRFANGRHGTPDTRVVGVAA